MDDRIVDFLKIEYDEAKSEHQYYAEQISRQDTLFNVYFTIFSIAMAVICNVIQINNKAVLLKDVILSRDQKVLVSGMCVLLGVLCAHLFTIISGNTYYLMVFEEKIAVLEKVLNNYLGKDVFIWETHFMSDIQSKNNVFHSGCMNVNYIKMFFAIILYFIIETLLSVILYYAVKTVALYFIPVIASITLFVLGNWIIMWWNLPKYCKNKLESLYQEKLGITIKDSRVTENGEKKEIEKRVSSMK